MGKRKLIPSPKIVEEVGKEEKGASNSNKVEKKKNGVESKRVKITN